MDNKQTTDEALNPLISVISEKVLNKLGVVLNEEKTREIALDEYNKAWDRGKPEIEKDIEKTIKIKAVEAFKEIWPETKKHLSDNLEHNFQSRFLTIADTIERKFKAFKTEVSKDSPSTPRVVEIRDYRLLDENGNPRIFSIDHQHQALDTLLNFVRLRLPVYIYGPTGGGKTTATKLVAEILGLPFYRKVMSSQSSESTLMGYTNSAGVYVPGIAYVAYKDGGVLLIDEIDNGNANINTVIKQLNDGDICFFPGVGNIDKHKDFHLIANANTVGNGATRQYVGRAPQDKAMLNTFVFLEWEYDKEFEKELAIKEWLSSGGKQDALHIVHKDLEDCWKLRQAADELKMDYILSTRNILYLVRANAQGVDLKTRTKSFVTRGMDKEQMGKIIAKANTIGNLLPATAMDVSNMFNEDHTIP